MNSSGMKKKAMKKRRGAGFDACDGGPAAIGPCRGVEIMGVKVTGFLEYTRETPERRPPAERVNDWFEIYNPFPEDRIRSRARAAWIAACPSAIPAARSPTSFPTGTIWCGADAGSEAIRVLHSHQ
jgi:hypothetical protein